VCHAFGLRLRQCQSVLRQSLILAIRAPEAADRSRECQPARRFQMFTFHRRSLEQARLLAFRAY